MKVGLSFKPIGTWAIKKFNEYGADNIKVYKTDSKSVMFVNKDCDTSSDENYKNTFKFGFWVDRKELNEVESND